MAGHLPRITQTAYPSRVTSNLSIQKPGSSFFTFLFIIAGAHTGDAFKNPAEIGRIAESQYRSRFPRGQQSRPEQFLGSADPQHISITDRRHTGEMMKEAPELIPRDGTGLMSPVLRPPAACISTGCQPADRSS